MASNSLQTQYQYKAIGKDDIRLLKWPRKRPRKDGDSIQLSLVTVLRSEAPKYTALSYEWTQHAASESIYIDKQHLLVRPNLYDGLKRLRERRDFWEYLWVDALCIDQANPSERNDQVQRMAGTYRDASTVVAWLGNDTRLDRKHWKLSSVYKAAEIEYFEKPMDEADAMKMYSPPYGSHLRLSLRQRHELTPPRRGHAVKILDLSYWTRRWVVQEIHLARRLDFLWGRFSFTWDDICLLVAKYTQRVPCEEGLHTEHEAQICTWFIGTRDAARVFLDTNHIGASENSGHSVSLHNLLVDHYQSVCLDPRDRIFALLGILPQEERRLFANFFPDYALSFCQVTLMVCAYLKQTDWRGDIGTGMPVHVRGSAAEELAMYLDISTEKLAICLEISNVYEVPDSIVSIETPELDEYRRYLLDDFEQDVSVVGWWGEDVPKAQWGDEQLLRFHNVHEIMVTWRRSMIRFLGKLAQDFAGYGWDDLRAWLAGRTQNPSERH